MLTLLLNVTQHLLLNRSSWGWLNATRMNPSNFLHMFEMSCLEIVGGSDRIKIEE